MRDSKSLWSYVRLKALIKTMAKTKQIFSTCFVFLLPVLTTEVYQILEKKSVYGLKTQLYPPIGYPQKLKWQLFYFAIFVFLLLTFQF